MIAASRVVAIGALPEREVAVLDEVWSMPRTGDGFHSLVAGQPQRGAAYGFGLVTVPVAVKPLVSIAVRLRGCPRSR